MTIDVREQITEWLTGNDTCFLMGAGCSMCAGKPLIGKLTENVLNDADAKLKEHFGALKASGERPATIEDLINYLVRYRDILDTITNADGHSVSVSEIDSWLTDIKKKIVTEVADDWEAGSYHERFLQRLRGPRDRSPRDIFSLNYDTLLEASLDSVRLPYTDGFRGTNRGWFDSSTFDEAGAGIAYRIFKLHGSINWTRDTSGYVRRGRNANEDAADEPIVVYPSEQKYLQTQYGVYETLVGMFRNRLRIPGVNNCLVVLGYSFNDEHINEAIFDAVNANNSNLTIIAFVGPEQDRGKQDERLTAFSARCDSRFNAFVGDDQTGTFIGHALDADAANAVLKGDFWKFENLVDFIAGDGMSDQILKIGRVVEVSGSKVIGELEGTVEDLYRTYKSRRYTVGQVGSIVKIEAGDKLVFGVVTALRMTETLLDGDYDAHLESASDAKWLEIELFGEAVRTGLGESEFSFQRGVVTYPLPGQGIFVASVSELARIYHRPDKPSIHVGTLSQAASLPVYLLTDDLLGKHFAVLGTTGSGKSCSVTVLLRSILDVAPKAHMILLDPHNEYRRAFPDNAEIIDPTSLNLPHWLLNFEESMALFIGKTEFVATSQTNILKDAILAARQDFGAEGIAPEKITVDTPVPYKLSKLLAHVEANMPPQDSKKDPYLKIKNKIQTLQQDSRFSFLIRPDENVSDELKDIVGQYLRIPVSDKPLSIIDLSGVPSDVVDVVVSLLCRMIFDFAVWSPRPVQVPIVLVCEEAHRYAPRRDEAAFQPTKQALSRIAKEGRKYGVGLGLISQRPSELAESILSQCNTLIALRMSNEQDQNFVQRALPDSVRSLVNVLPTLRTQEALVVGEGTVVPVRLRFNDLAEEHQPQSADVPFAARWAAADNDAEYVESVVRRWRLQERPPIDPQEAGNPDE